MTEFCEITLTIHGFDEFKQAVDGEVFADKLSAFMKGLVDADIAANGKRRYTFLISELKKSSATASVRESMTKKGEVPQSSIGYFCSAMHAIAEESPRAKQLPLALVRQIKRLNKGVGKSFHFGEIRLPDDNVIRIDEYLRRKTNRLLKYLEEDSKEQFFAGAAYVSFDGVLKEIDLRGASRQAVLILTAGGSEIQCVVDDIDLDYLRKCLDRRATISGLARYGSEQGLPELIRVTHIQLQAKDTDLASWRGQFQIPPRDDEEWSDR